MSTYSELQQELMMLWNSRIKEIDGLKETGRKFRMSKPMHYVMNSSQKNYKALMLDMKKQMRSMRKQMADLQREMNDVLKMMNSESKGNTGNDIQLSK
jgi:predicted patatin/cPLA2 family phospholipase